MLGVVSRHLHEGVKRVVRMYRNIDDDFYRSFLSRNSNDCDGSIKLMCDFAAIQVLIRPRTNRRSAIAGCGRSFTRHATFDHRSTHGLAYMAAFSTLAPSGG